MKAIVFSINSKLSAFTYFFIIRATPFGFLALCGVTEELTLIFKFADTVSSCTSSVASAPTTQTPKIPADSRGWVILSPRL